MRHKRNAKKVYANKKKPSGNRYYQAYKFGSKLANTVVAAGDRAFLKNKTKTKKITTGNKPVMSVDEGSSKCSFGKWKAPLAWHKDFPVQNNYYSGGDYVHHDPGTQEYVTPILALTAAQLASWYQSQVDISLNTTANQRFQLFIENVSGKVIFKNEGNSQQMITLYQLSVKRSSQYSPITLIQEGTAAKFAVTPTGDTRYKNIGFNPLFSTEFSKHFKVEASRNIILDPGSIHQHTYIYNIHKNFATSDYQKELLSNNTTYISGLTKILMVRVHGTPSTDTNGTLVSTSSGKLIWTQTEKVGYRMITAFKEKSDSTNQTLVKTLTGEKVLVEDSDTIQNIVN